MRLLYGTDMYISKYIYLKKVFSFKLFSSKIKIFNRTNTLQYQINLIIFIFINKSNTVCINFAFLLTVLNKKGYYLRWIPI